MVYYRLATMAGITMMPSELISIDGDEHFLTERYDRRNGKNTVFNILATNVDAHIRNFSFMMEEGGTWHITPAYDLTFSCFNPGNKFDPAHYLRIGGKTVDIGYEDLVEKYGRVRSTIPQCSPGGWSR